jgi:hypothetical protein
VHVGVGDGHVRRVDESHEGHVADLYPPVLRSVEEDDRVACDGVRGGDLVVVVIDRVLVAVDS